MAKRRKLDFDSDELTQNLKQSAGQGVDALFSPPSPAPSAQPIQRNGKSRDTQAGVRPADEETATAETGPGKANGRTAGTRVRPDVLLDQVPSAPEQRRPERYAFQFWADQITRLKKLNQVLNLTKDPQDREAITLSDMVRQAVDDYLDEQIKQIKRGVRSDA